MHAPVYDIEEERHQHDVFLGVLDRAMAAAEGTGESFALIGELCSATVGRDRGTRDIDLFVRPASAPIIVDALRVAGFEVETVDDHWLYRAHHSGIAVDVIFRATRDILLDDEMARRVTRADIYGRLLPVVPAEDLLVMKALATDEDTARYWYDALAILARTDLDWGLRVDAGATARRATDLEPPAVRDVRRPARTATGGRRSVRPDPRGRRCPTTLRKPSWLSTSTKRSAATHG
jgi:predicted nucleotidyltransferase